MAELNRRDFFKVVGISGASAVAGCKTAPFENPLNVQTPVEELYPYVVQPDQITPGAPTFFSTICTGCSASCGAVARHREGRVVFLAGNPDSPVGGTGLCAAGTASLQDTYDPDRFTAPVIAGAPATWDVALDTVAKALEPLKGSGKVAWLGRYRTGALANLIGDFMGAVGGRELHWEPLGYESLVKATNVAFGVNGAPRYDIAVAQIILGFGADFLHTWLDGVHHSAGWAQARDPKVGGVVAEYIEIAPRLSHTGTRCDTWLSNKPGTEAGVALALAKLVATKRGNARGAESWLASVDPAALASAAGIAPDKLDALADRLAREPSVVFPGGVTTNGDNAGQLALATLVLNYVCGNIGQTVKLGQHINLGKVSNFGEVETLLRECADGKIDVLFLDDLDPIFTLPTSVGAAAALAKVPHLVVFTNRISESVTAGAVVLPPGSSLETWGDAESVVSFHGLQQPAMKALNDTRSVGDVLLSLAKTLALTMPAPVASLVGMDLLNLITTRGGPPEAPVITAPAWPMLGGKTATATFEAEDFYRYLAGYWFNNVYSKDGTGKTFANWWVDCLTLGGFFTAVVEPNIAIRADLPPANPGAAVAGEMALLVFPHARLFDGRHAHKAWMQEIPDPVSGYTWTSWGEISPATAKRLGVGNADAMDVKTDAGTVTVGVRVSKGMRDDAVALVLGNGAQKGNRYAKGWGVNPFHLLSDSKDTLSGAMATLGGSATVSRAGTANERKSLKGSEGMDERPIALTTFVGDVLSGHATEPGSLAPTHKVPEDERLVEKGIHDFYPEPQHPTYRFAMAIDLDACTGCGACEAACVAENNIAITGPLQHSKWRYMGWIRLDRFWEGEGEHPDVRYMPALCQQCSHAPCEAVCPVVATYHNLEGLNAMIYNRCVGTRYCANNCPYSARRFNFHTYRWPEAYELMLNPDVSTREAGVMEKCTFCVQRLRYTKATYRSQGPVPSEVWTHLPACAEICPSKAITFGNALDAAGAVAQQFASPRAYTLLGELNTKPGVRYLTRLSFQQSAHGSGHGGEGHEAAPSSEHNSTGAPEAGHH